MSTWESKEKQSHQLLLLTKWKAGQQNHRASLALKSEPYTTQHYQILNIWYVGYGSAEVYHVANMASSM